MNGLLRKLRTARTPATLGLLLAFFGTLLFSFKSIVVKLAYHHGIGGEQLIALRMLFSAPIYLGIFLWHQIRKPILVTKLRDIFWVLMVAGIFGYYLASLLDLWGLELISAQLERLILFTYPGFVMLLSFMLFKKVPSRTTVIALLLTYVGIATVVGVEAQGQWQDVLTGGTLVLISAFLFACYLLLSKRGIAALGSQVYTCLALLIASVAVAVHMMLAGNINLVGLQWQAYFWAAVMSIVCTVIPSLLIAGAIGRLGPQLTSILGGLGPVMTAGLAVIVLGEVFTILHLIGTALVVAGAWLVVFEAKSA
ncbi:DMT family transporter [Alteromonas sp. a30]|uniref:DMT family transporter n=1 Tax=Alteromonas sp. a30 TaxID=2730917 RepID=UPI00227E17A6|nr:DMT family transporter [Alteromonas sp. a30]MCY7294489.1 DMT family transporter [Alteromonas sp. a30]